jgi:hypothetical protein
MRCSRHFGNGGQIRGSRSRSNSGSLAMLAAIRCALPHGVAKRNPKRVASRAWGRSETAGTAALGASGAPSHSSSIRACTVRQYCVRRTKSGRSAMLAAMRWASSRVSWISVAGSDATCGRRGRRGTAGRYARSGFARRRGGAAAKRPQTTHLATLLPLLESPEYVTA